MNNKYKQILSIIAILFVTMLIVSGSTFAYLQWQSSSAQQTALNIKVTEKINMHIENYQITDKGMYPTNTCNGPGALTIDEVEAPEVPDDPISIITIENQTGVMARPRFKLKVKITDINGNPITSSYRHYINYAVTEVNGDCTAPLISGKFDIDEVTSTGGDWYNSDWITKFNDNGFPSISNGMGNGVSFNASPYGTTTHQYRLWAWIDSSYTTTVVGNQSVTDPMQDATISISWSEDSKVDQIRAEAYAVYSSDDKSLRFYKSDKPISVGSTYNGRNVTYVYKDFEAKVYAINSAPWFSRSSYVEKIVFEDQISPVSTAGWFNVFTKVSYIDVSKLDMSVVQDMNSMFSSVGTSTNVTEFTIVGLENWDTSSAKDMSYMFSSMGYKASEFNIGDISGWNTANVTNMSFMCNNMGSSATNNWSLNLSGWDTRNVISSLNFKLGTETRIISPFN